MKILIVDDSKGMRMIVKRTLRQAGYDNCTIQEAANGVEALQRLEGFTPDVILSDWNMPEMSGLALLEELNARGQSIPLGFVTSEGTPQMRQKAEETGALFLLTKPFTVEQFQDALGKVPVS